MKSIARTVAGFAVAFGIAGAAAVALADQASAAPGRSGSSVDGSARDSRGSRAEPVHRKPRPRAVAVREVSVPAAPAAATRDERRPVRTAPAAPVVAAPTTAPAPAAAPVTRGRLITIYKGTHFAIPNSFGYFIKKVGGTGTFTADTVYDLKDEDQKDWNKFTGIAFTPLEPDRNSVMVGWRYNLVSQEFEIAPFYNVDKKRILPNEQTEVISVPAGETFDYFVDYSGVRISYGGKTVYKPYPEGLKPNVWTAARVSGWFGGNEVAPRTVSYFLKFAR